MKVALEDGQAVYRAPTIEEQIAEVGREIGLRRNVYKKFVERGTMSKGMADQHIARLEAAYQTLKWVQKNADTLRRAVAE